MYIAYMTKQDQWEFNKNLWYWNFKKEVECPLMKDIKGLKKGILKDGLGLNDCEWLKKWFNTNYKGENFL